VASPFVKWPLSVRNLGQVLKIDAQSGAILWRLEGLKNDFTFVNDPMNAVSAQHSVRVFPDGNLLLFDKRDAPRAPREPRGGGRPRY
jgi:hypothetical protein